MTHNRPQTNFTDKLFKSWQMTFSSHGPFLSCPWIIKDMIFKTENKINVWISLRGIHQQIKNCFMKTRHNKELDINVAGPERWLRRIGYRRPYGDPCGGDALPGGDSNAQYAPYCGNQRPARLLIVVLLYFYGCSITSMWRWWWFCPQKYSSTYGLTLTRLSYAVNLSSALIRRAPMHTVLKTHITK